jgi:hypothetical protein
MQPVQYHHARGGSEHVLIIKQIIMHSTKKTCRKRNSDETENVRDSGNLRKKNRYKLHTDPAQRGKGKIKQEFKRCCRPTKNVI